VIKQQDTTNEEKPMTTKHPLHSILTPVAITLLLVACASGGAVQGTTPPAEVSIQFSWTPTIEWAGFYVAEAEGYYAEENISVELLAGGYDADGNYIDPISEVLSGDADFGVTEAGILMEARAGGAPVVAIASIYQRHPLAMLSLAEKNITRPQDMIGKTVQVSENTVVVYHALLAAQGIDPAQVNEVERTDFTTAPLINGEADVIDAWVTYEVVEMQRDGYDTNLILASDYGIEMYPDIIFTTEEMINDRPDVVERFLRATLRGTQGAVDDPEKATNLSLERSPERDPDFELETMRRSVPLLNPTGSRPGMMTDEAWEKAYQIMVEQGMLTDPLDVKEAYTLEFLQKIYE
jgi:NitT/TauT family transport system substrate-binding protein